MRNTTGKRDAGSSFAAVFLKQFVNHKRWLHLDVAGASYMASKQHGIYEDYTGLKKNSNWNEQKKKKSNLFTIGENT